MPDKAFGDRFKVAFNNESNQKIADKLGVSAPAVQNYKDGRIPDGEKLKRIASVTKCDLHWLITGEKETKKKIETIKVIDLLGERELEEIEEQRIKWIENNNEDISLEDFLRELLIWGSVHDLNAGSKAEIELHFETDDYTLNTDYVLRRSIVEIVRNEIIYGESRENILKLVKELFFVNTLSSTNNVLPFETKESKIQDFGNIDEFNVEEAVSQFNTLEETIEAWYKFEGKKIPEGFGLNFGGWKKLSLEDKIQTVKDVKNFADEMNEKIDRGEIEYD